jgi:hypothetical protein
MPRIDADAVGPAWLHSAFGGSTVRTTLVVFALMLALLFLFGRAKERSLRRASAFATVGELLSAEKYWREHGVVTNFNSGYTVYRYTNQISAGGTDHQGVLATRLERIRDLGFSVLTTDGTVLWIDRELQPSVMRRPDGSLQMPERFK